MGAQPIPSLEVDFYLSSKQNEALEYLEDRETEKVFFGGAAGGGKSMFGCYWHITQRIKYPGSRGVIGRSKISVLKESTMVTFLKVCNKLKLVRGVHYHYSSTSNKIRWYNGSETILLDMFYYPSDPDFQRFGSTEYTDAFVDEALEVTERAVELLFTRLRWKISEFNILPKMLLTGNPGDGWVKNTFIQDKDDNPVLLPPTLKKVLALVTDNPDKGFVGIYKKTLEGMTNDYDKERLLHGNWNAVPRTGYEYYHPFRRDLHVVKYSYNRDLPLHITFDFNAGPYMTLLVFQILHDPVKHKYIVRGVKEYCLDHPFNNTQSICKKFADDFRFHQEGIFYYGDYSGKSRNTMAHDDIRHNYDIIRKELAAFMMPNSNRVITNKSILRRRDFLIDILMGKVSIEFSFDPSMRTCINEFYYMKQGPDGLKFKDSILNTKTNLTYEKYGHVSDASEYFLCSCFNQIFKSYDRRQ